MSDCEISEMPVNSYKNLIKRRVAFCELLERQSTHSKVRDILYTNLSSPQDYISSKYLSQDEINIIFALRSHTIRDIISNFPNQNRNISALCPICSQHIDNQEGVLLCEKLKTNTKEKYSVSYNQIYGNPSEQKEIAQVYIKLLAIRASILKEIEESCLPGQSNTGRGLPGGGQ